MYPDPYQDVDECLEGLAQCQADEECHNTVGAYDCQLHCDLGFQFSQGLQTCVGEYTFIRKENNERNTVNVRLSFTPDFC